MNNAFSKICIISILAAVLAGGILAWQKFNGLREEVKKPQLVSFEIAPSCAGNAGWIIYPNGAKAVAKGENLDRVEFWKSPTGTGMEDILYTESEIVKKDNQWEISLPNMLFATDFYAVGYDSMGEKMGKISLGNIYGSDQSARYPKDCKKNETADWKTYTNAIFKYQIGYPSGFEVMLQTEREKSQLGEGQNICIAKSGKDFCKLIINTFEFGQYKLIDNAGGFTFEYDVAKKQWVHYKTNETSQFAPQRLSNPLEAYLYRTGDVGFFSEYILIPNISLNRLIEITNITRRDDDGNIMEGYEKIDSSQILSTFRFLK